MENVDLQFKTFGNVKITEFALYVSDVLLTDEREVSGWNFAGGGQALEAAAGGEGGLDDQGD